MGRTGVDDFCLASAGGTAHRTLAVVLGNLEGAGGLGGSGGCAGVGAAALLPGGAWGGTASDEGGWGVAARWRGGLLSGLRRAAGRDTGIW